MAVDSNFVWRNKDGCSKRQRISLKYYYITIGKKGKAKKSQISIYLRDIFHLTLPGLGLFENLKEVGLSRLSTTDKRCENSYSINVGCHGYHVTPFLNLKI